MAEKAELEEMIRSSEGLSMDDSITAMKRRHERREEWH